MDNFYPYWCFGCLQHFQTQIKVNVCPLCSSQAIELAENNIDDPSGFQVYQIPNHQPQQQSQLQQHHPLYIQQQSSNNPTAFQQFGSNQQGLIIPPVVGRLQVGLIGIRLSLENFLEALQGIIGGQDGILNLLNSLTGQGNLEAATQQEINRLQRLDKATECSICQEQQQRQGYKLQCGHMFHIDCLNPWLQRTNTCPVCRSHI